MRIIIITIVTFCIIKYNVLIFVSEYRSNFDKQSLKNTTYQFEYDYDSVMHYGKNFFRYTKQFDNNNIMITKT